MGNFVIQSSKASSKADMIKIFIKAGYTEAEIEDYYRYRELKARKNEQKRGDSKGSPRKSYKNK